MIGVVYRKEMLELARDRKTLWFILLLPTLIIPLVTFVMSYYTVATLQGVEQEPITYTLRGAEYAPDLQARLQASPRMQHVDLAANEDLTQAVQQEKIKFALVVPAQAAQQLQQKQAITVTFYFNNAELTPYVQQRVHEIIEAWNKHIQGQWLAELPWSKSAQEALLQPIKLDVKNTASTRQDWGGKFGGMLPYLLFILCLTGAMYPAIDVGAGEKEHGTLETLLLSPVPYGRLVMAKFLVIFTTGFATAALCLLSFCFWWLLLGRQLAADVLIEVANTLGALDISLILLLLMPVSGIFAALLLSISIYARSFKEAQNYMGPLSLLAALPIVTATLPGVELDKFWVWVPLTNIALAMKELVKGTVNNGLLTAIWLSSMFWVGLLLAFCRYWFSQEKVLFRS